MYTPKSTGRPFTRALRTASMIVVFPDPFGPAKTRKRGERAMWA
ncbi:MAG: hypothetical protein RBT71_01735 [Flavobacteriales bacterium]|jgi:hypothetical protein|nr:hypothetical protein [Flavobacteriales bacterium]